MVNWFDVFIKYHI